MLTLMGMEMNLYVPQTVESKAELLELSQNKQNYISYNDSKPILVPVQDALIGLYVMTNIQNVSSKMFSLISYPLCTCTNEATRKKKAYSNGSTES